MRFIITCGGSGGHINPGLAVARVLRDSGHEVLFVGAPSGLERDLVPREGFPIEFVEVRSLSHSLKPKAIVRNAGVAVKMAVSLRQAKKIIKRFRPDAVLGTGGYASFPALYEASRMKIPTLVHESNAFPGITTKLIASRADKILVAMESCKTAYKRQEHVRVVGMPVRREFFETDRLAAREALKLDNRPLVVSIFGSQGAGDMNRVILQLMKLERGEWQHIHAAGPKPYASVSKTAAEQGLVCSGETGLRLVDYIHNMAEVFAAADVIVCRAGSSTLAELCAAGCPAVLIPSPNVTADHQTANAKVLAGAGGAILLPEKELTAEKLFGTISELLTENSKLEAMRKNLQRLAVRDSANQIASLMEKAVM